METSNNNTMLVTKKYVTDTYTSRVDNGTIFRVA